jgi:mRNA interferase HicA
MEAVPFRHGLFCTLVARPCSNVPYTLMCTEMKKRDLDRELGRLGWWLKRQGGSHEIWTNGEETEAVPRHREIKEGLARKILEKAKGRLGPRM